jgi:alpha-amylase
MNKLFSTFFFLLSSSLLLTSIYARTAEEWKSRSVYQIITDRFAKTDGDSTPCDDFGNYCGGTFKGILNNLDYIQGMGFDAIWISPIVANTPGGYHGYWTSNLYEINENFGTPEELIELIQTCHARDIWVMVDVVANHMGYVENEDFSSIVPFSDISYYNTYKHCDEIDFAHQPSVESCWLNGLPDLNQNNRFVRDTLLSWATDFVQAYDIDALRIDTVPHVSKDFWQDFSKAAGVYTIGEVLNFDLPYLASYQGSMDAVLNYALYSTL